MRAVGVVNGRGDRRQRLNAEVLADELFLPLLDEQERIVAYLDEVSAAAGGGVGVGRCPFEGCAVASAVGFGSCVSG